MGSTGSGSFSDYSRNTEDDNRCEKAFSVKLQDVEQFEYYKKHDDVPPIGTVLSIALGKRLIAKTPDGEAVGSLPTSFNYLAGCLAQGYVYSGSVRQSDADTSPVLVGVDFAATSPK